MTNLQPPDSAFAPTILVGVDFGLPNFDGKLEELGLLAQTAGLTPVARITCKRWIAELSGGPKKTRSSSTPESRRKAGENPFVKDVCDLFNGPIIDSRG